MSNNKQIEKKLKLPHRETVISTNTIQTKPFDNQKIEIMSNNKQSMTNPFLQDAESIHQYNNQMFVVDYYPHPNGGTWQCCDANHYFRTRANTKEKAIQEAHNKWDKHKNNEQQ